MGKYGQISLFFFIKMITDLELFKEIAKHPKFSEPHENLVKMIYKVWSGFTRFIRSHILNGKNVNAFDIGRFVTRTTTESGNIINFIPSQRFYNPKQFTYRNSSSIQKNESKDKSSDQTVSYSAIAHVCGLDRTIVSNAIKDIVWKSQQLAISGKCVELNLKVGKICIDPGFISFKMQITPPKGGNKSVDGSQRSGSLRSAGYTSVRTPNTGRTSSARPSTSQTKGFHASNPNPLYQGAGENMNNFYRATGIKRDPMDPKIPYPFFHGTAGPVIQRQGRRLNFDQPVTAEELLNAHRMQMQAKQAKKVEEKKRSKQDELTRITEINDKLMADRERKSAEEEKKRHSFIESNEEQREVRANLAAKTKQDRQAEKFDHFPFTHGDLIEQYQEEMKQKLATELKSHYASMPVPIQVSGSNKQSVNEKVPYHHITDYPKFLKQSEYHPTRRFDTSHVENAMQEALNRYEKDLIKLETEQDLRDQEHHRQQLHNAQYYEHLMQERSGKIQENKKFLQLQMQERSAHKDMDKAERKEFVRTNFGPEEHMEDQQDEVNRYSEQKNEVRAALYNQMKDKYDKTTAQKLQEREEDIENLITAADVMATERHKNATKVDETKKLYKQAWEQQQKMREIEKTVGKHNT